MMNHDKAYELLEDYVLGNIESSNAEMVEAHIDAGCPECQLRLHEISEISVKLASDMPQLEPSKQVKVKLLNRIKQSSHNKRTTIFNIFQNYSWVSAAAVVLIVALSSLSLTLLKINRDLKRELTDTQDITALLNSPGMQFVDLEGVDPNPQAFGKVVVDPEKGAAVVYMYALPQTPEGMEYQLWVMREGKPTSAGLFTVTEDGSAMLALEELSNPRDIGSFLVTIEPTGGQVSPTGMMYLTGSNVFQSSN
jgi:anti-sigma-K factor RskA